MVPNPVPATKKDILILTIARADTRQPIHGAVQPRLLPRPVPAVLLREPVTKPRRIPTAIAVPAGTRHPAVHPLRPKLGQLLRFALAALLPAPAISARLKPVPIHVFILYVLVQPTVIVRAAR